MGVRVLPVLPADLMGWKVYRPGDGKIMRTAFLAVLMILGVYTAYSWHKSDWGGATGYLPVVWDHPVTSGEVGAGVIVLAFMVGSYLVCFANRKAGDFLIETEIEMRKVTWPTWKPWLSPKTQLWGATYVVIILMLVIAGFIAFVDVLLQMAARAVFYGT